MNQLSEKRYIVFPNNVVWDNQLDEVVCRCILEGSGDAENVCQRLNEQSERIKSLEMELDLIANTKLFSRRKLEEENKQMKKQLEQIPKSIREVWLE